MSKKIFWVYLGHPQKEWTIFFLPICSFFTNCFYPGYATSNILVTNYCEKKFFLWFSWKKIIFVCGGIGIHRVWLRSVHHTAKSSHAKNLGGVHHTAESESKTYNQAKSSYPMQGLKLFFSGWFSWKVHQVFLRAPGV